MMRSKTPEPKSELMYNRPICTMCRCQLTVIPVCNHCNENTMSQRKTEIKNQKILRMKYGLWARR